MADSNSLPGEAETGRPEDELLVRCARVSRPPEGDPRIGALLRGKLDWDYLLRAAGEHGTMPLLHRHLGDGFEDYVPEPVLDRLRNYSRANKLRNLLLTGELLRLLRMFEAHGIPVIPYKGPVLATSVYGDLALRQFNDLDVLVHKEDIPRAEELLSSAGYRPQYRLTRAQRAAFLRYQCEHPFWREEVRSEVDLHWGITERHFSFPLDPESLWGRLERASLGGDTVSTFSPEDLLLILCVHGSKDLWERLKLVCDVAELVRVHRGMEWERVVERASTLGSERMLFLGLFLANDLLGAALPEEVLQRVRADPAVKTLAGRVRERLFREANRQSKVFEESPFHPLHLKMRERLRDRLRYCVRTATTHTVGDWAVLPLPRPLFPLYYVLRPLRLAAKYGQRLVRRVPR